MKIRTAVVLGGLFLTSGVGAGVVACSSSSSGGTQPGVDSGTEDTSAPPPDGNTPAVDANMPTPDGGSGVDCGSNPTLHAGDGTELYCPFGPDAGAAIQCAAKSQCCCISGKVGGSYPPSTCEAYGDAGGCACANGAVAGTTQIQCEDPGTDCPVAGSACCASPAPGPVAGCSYEKITGWTYARCVAPTDGGAAGACSAGEVTVCSSTPQCPTGKTCTAVKAKGIQLGVCM